MLSECTYLNRMRWPGKLWITIHFCHIFTPWPSNDICYNKSKIHKLRFGTSAFMKSSSLKRSQTNQISSNKLFSNMILLKLIYTPKHLHVIYSGSSLNWMWKNPTLNKCVVWFICGVIDCGQFWDVHTQSAHKHIYNI